MRFAPNCPIDVGPLLAGRMLVQANSGAGKSHALRLLLEQTHGKVQHLVIDPEGEFSTLREKFDYVICAPEAGDAVAHPGTAALLARRLLENRASAILNIYELKHLERIAFVRRFCEELVNARRDLWHPVLIVLDEAHMFCPEKGKAESAAAVIDLATRGRKRGFALVLATQRLSKLHKDAAAEMINKLVGRTGLDIDVKRAAEELGLSGREAARDLRTMEPGEFFAYGPALTATVTRIKVDPVKTTHPKAGGRLLSAPPPPSAAIRALLAQGLQDIPREAEVEARTLAEVKQELAKKSAALVAAEKRAAAAGVPEVEVARRIAAAVKEARATSPAVPTFPAEKVRGLLRKALETMDRAPAEVGKAGAAAPAPMGATSGARAVLTIHPAPRAGSVPGLRSGAVGILQQLAARMPAGYSHAQVATLCRFSPNGGTFKTYIGDLKRGGYIEVREGLVYATDHGVKSLGGSAPAAPRTHEEAMTLWRGALRAGAFRMLEEIVNHQGVGIDRPCLARNVQMEGNGGTFKTYLGDLKRNGLIEERGGLLRASAILQPMGVAA